MSATEQPEPVEPQEQPQEPGTPEPDAEPAPEPDAPQEPAEPLQEPPNESDTQSLMEDRGKRFEKLSMHVAKRTTEILGDDVEIAQECVLCSYWGMPGWIPTVAPPQDLQEALYHYLGSHAPTEFREDKYSRPCESCGGMGEVRTGSKAFGQDKLPCVDCNHRGWIPVGNERAGGLLSLANGPSAQALGVTPADAAMQPDVSELPPEVEALRAQGFTVFPPIKIPG